MLVLVSYECFWIYTSIIMLSESVILYKSSTVTQMSEVNMAPISMET